MRQPTRQRSRWLSSPPGDSRPHPLKSGAIISLAANCDPTIVAGVSIKGEASSGKKGDCTSGPAVIRQDRSTTTKATETFLLTAGHCIKDLGGNGKKWIAFNKAGEEKEIGKAFEYLFPTIPGVPGVDIGVIKVESNVWAKAEDPPLNPEHTEWEAAAETDPTSVTASADPVKGTNSCFSGQRSGLQCGTVKNAEMQAPVETSSGVVVTVGIGCRSRTGNWKRRGGRQRRPVLQLLLTYGGARYVRLIRSGKKRRKRRRIRLFPAAEARCSQNCRRILAVSHHSKRDTPSVNMNGCDLREEGEPPA